MRLLAMLEPPVRPGNAPAAAARLLQRGEGDEAGLPIEQRSFESLLRDARHQPAEVGAVPDNTDNTDAAARRQPPGPLAQLAGLDHIENASVRQIHSARRQDAAGGLIQ